MKLLCYVCLGLLILGEWGTRTGCDFGESEWRGRVTEGCVGLDQIPVVVLGLHSQPALLTNVCSPNLKRSRIVKVLKPQGTWLICGDRRTQLSWESNEEAENSGYSSRSMLISLFEIVAAHLVSWAKWAWRITLHHALHLGKHWATCVILEFRLPHN